MDDAVLVGVVERLADLDRQLDHLAPGQLAALLEDLLQGDALDVLHREVGRPLEPAPGQEPDDVGVAELLEDLGLALEPLVDLALLGELAVDDLDGGRPAGRLVRRPEDDPHRAGAEDRLDPERAQLFADEPLTHGRNHNSVVSLEPLEHRPGGSIRNADARRTAELERERPSDRERRRGVRPGASRTTGRRPPAGSCAGRSPSPSGRR